MGLISGIHGSSESRTPLPPDKPMPSGRQKLPFVMGTTLSGVERDGSSRHSRVPLPEEQRTRGPGGLAESARVHVSTMPNLAVGR